MSLLLATVRIAPAGALDSTGTRPRAAARRRLAAAVGLCLALQPISLAAQPITFSVIGDVPYDDSELPVLQQHMVDHNLYSPGDFLIHVGDIFGGGTPCQEYRYQQVADVLKMLTVPAIMLPGDNETKDCDDPTQAWTYWTTHFMRLESNFCSDITFWHQTGREENIAFVSKGVLFIGIHLVGGSNPSDVLQADADWVEQHLQQQAPFVRAAVVLAQAGPGSGRDLFFNQFVPDAVAFGKPVIYIHGDGHSWIDDMPFGASNMRRVQVERGNKPPIAVTVTTDAVPLFVIDRNPFDGSTVNMPPCVDAGPDLGIGIAQQAWLRGQADDDGDPGSASLSLNWSKVSGPGTVTFTSPGSAETYASFSLVGTYVLRLRASDGIVASTDDVTVTVSTTAPTNNPPVAVFDSYSTLMQRTLTMTAPGVLANDSDPNGTAITAVLVSGTTHGTLSLNANGGFTYTPQAGYYGLDGFSYRASDGNLQSNIASVTLNVTPFTLTLTPVDDGTGNSSTPSKPAGSSSNLRVEADVTSYRSFLKFTVAGTGTTVYRAKLRLFVTNGSPDGGSLYRVSNYFPGTTTAWTEETLTWANMPAIAGTALGSAGSVDADEFVEFDVTSAIRGDGTYSFGLKSASTNNVDYSSKEGEESPLLVIETLPGGGGTNLTPVALDNAYTVAEDGSLVQSVPGVLANDTDANGDALAVIQTSTPAHGTLALAANGSFTYTPSANYNGPDTFSYSADDFRGGLDPAVVTLTVTAVNDPPVAVDESFSTPEDTPLTVAAPGVRSNDTDVDGDALTVSVFAQPAHGTLALGPSGGFTYTPAPDWNGVDNFTYTATDGKGGSDTGSVTLTVSAVEDPPRATDDSFTTGEDQSLTVPAPGLLGNDADPEGDAMTTIVAAAPTHGNLALGADGSFTYTPVGNYNGPDAFTYTLRDAKGGTDTGSVSLVVTAVNDAPMAVDDTGGTNEDLALVVAAPGLLANDSDLDGDALVATVSTPPAHGTVTIATAGGYTYAPSPNFNGVDTFGYMANDGHGGTAAATVTIAVAAVNDAPDAIADGYATAEDARLDVGTPGILANDVDADGDPLTVALLTPPAQGALTLGPDGGFAYVPPPDFNGVVGFTYTVSDDRGGSETGTVTLTVNPVNDAPVAADDVHVLDEDVALTLVAPGILGNDTDVDADALSASVVVPPAHGTLTLAANGGLTFVPARDYVGNDSFTYRANDPSNANDTATVTLVIRSVNDLPVVAADTYSATEDVTLTVAAPGLLGNDADVDGDALYASLVAPPAHGVLQLGPDGSFTYTPAPDWNGDDTFTYGVTDTKGGTVSGTVTLSVAATNDPPVAADDTETTPEDTPLIRPAPGLLGNDVDVDGDGLRAAVAVPPAHGTLVLQPNGGFTYTPAANYFGADGFTYTVRDAQNVTDSGALLFTVVSVNDAPVAVTDGYVTNEDVALTVAAPGLLGNDGDVDGDALIAVVGTPPAHGTLTLNSNGGFVYTPARDYNGTDTFTYQARDPSGASDNESVVLYIAARNDAPVAASDTYATDEDVVLSVASPGLLANDTDVENDALTTLLASPPAHGTVQVAANGSFTYTPVPQYYGSDSFTYTLRDPSGASSTGSVALTVRSINDAPVAVNDSYGTDEDTPLVVAAPGVLGNDTDVENDALTAGVAAPPAHGSVVIAANGGFTYTPAEHYFGGDSFTYTLRDPSGATSTGSVALTVRAVNDPPVGFDDAYTTAEDTPLVVAAPGVLANDADIENDALSASLATPPAHGTLALETNGRFIYTPAPNYFGTDSFAYTLRDPSGATGAATVALTVRAVNDAPVATNDAYTLDEDTPLVVTAPGLAGNDSDVENDALTTTVGTPPAHGTVVLAANGGFTYTPASQYFGADSFTYTLRDPSGGTSSGTVSLAVQAVNDAPVVADDSYATDEDTPLAVAAPGLLANDADIEGDALRARLLSAPAHGTVELASDGSFTYRPAPDAFGADSFTYAVDDDRGGSTTGSVALAIRPVDDPPAVNGETYTIDEDTPLVVQAPGLLANDVDVDGDPLVAASAAPPAHGTLQLDANGAFRYTPALDFHGADMFTYTVDDGRGGARTATVTVTVRAVNDAPVVADQSFTTDEDTALDVVAPGVLAAATDVDGDALSAVLTTPPAHGTLELTGTGGFTYTPAADSFGPDAFEFEVRDGNGGSDRATVTLGVRPLPDAPDVSADVHTLAEDDSLVVAAPGLLANDTDVDGEALSARLDTPPTHGTVRLQPDGSFVYRPQPDFFGSDTFTYMADDGTGNTTRGTVTLTVTPVNDLPVAADDAYSTEEDTPLQVASPGLLANDRDADGDVVTVRLGDAPAHGVARLQPNGSFVYEPAADTNGEDAFTYVVDDGHGGAVPGTVRIVIAPLPDAPVASADTWSFDEDSQSAVAAPGVLANDTDVDGDVLSVRVVSPPAHGVLVLDASGGFHYQPTPDWNGTDTFVYAADDGTGRSALAPVTLAVRPVNDAPIAAPDAYVFAEDVVLTLPPPGILGNDSDVDAEALQSLLLTAPEHGTLILRTDGGLSFTPAPDYNGGDLFVYAAHDAAGATAAAVVRLDITAVNDAPRPGDDAYSLSEDDTLRVTAPGLLGNDTDVEGEALSAALSQPPAHGSVSITPDGGFHYVPVPDFAGDDGFVYVVQDASGAPSLAAVLLHVTPVNDAPRAAADSFVVTAAQPTTIGAPGLLGNDVDVDGDSLRAVVVEPPQYGALDLRTNGSFVYTPVPGYTGPDAFTYRIEDGLTTDTARVTLLVAGRGVTYHESATGDAAGQPQVETIAALAAVTGDLYLAAISTQPFHPAASITGMNLAWTRVRSQCGARGDTGVELWMARGAPSSGTVVASFGAAADHAVLVVSRYSGADASDPLGSLVGGNSSGIEAECGTGVESGEYAWSLHTLTEGGILYRALAMRDRDHAPTDGSFARARLAAGAAAAVAALEVDDRAVDAGDHAIGGRFSSAVDWAALAIEIRSARVDDTLRFSEALTVFPNPFTGRTLVQFTLYRRAAVDIQIFDVRGRLVRRLLNETRPPGRLQLDWNATDARGHTLDSGVYFLRLQSEGHTVTRKVVLLK